MLTDLSFKIVFKLELDRTQRYGLKQNSNQIF